MAKNARQFCGQEFADMWSRMNGSPSLALKLFEELAELYEEKHRKYHNLAHIAFCLKLFKQARHLAKDAHAVEFALFYHDAIYEPVPNAENEEKSAVLAENILWRGGFSFPLIQKVRALILATKHNRILTDPDEQLVSDIDLASLGQSEEVFEANYRAIRQEYARIPEEDFRKGNQRILRQLYERSPLYYHPFFQKKFGEQARKNLSRIINAPL